LTKAKSLIRMLSVRKLKSISVVRRFPEKTRERRRKVIVRLRLREEEVAAEDTEAGEEVVLTEEEALLPEILKTTVAPVIMMI
jgi:hypothetical protein